MSKKLNWRLGLDLGTNSLGWSVLELDKNQAVALTDLGVRIFHDGRTIETSGKVGNSLAADRSLARQARRQRYRKKLRKIAVIKALVKHGLFPTDKTQQKDLESLNPYEMRSKAADNNKLESYHLGRALFHLALHRGYKSNRTTDGEEEGEFFDDIVALQAKLNNQTLGQFLWKQYQTTEKTRFSREEKSGIFPRREMYEAEFDTIQEQQSSHHPLSPEQWQEIRKVIFYQRPLRPVERGKCQHFTDEPRAFTGLPISHEFRIVSEINNLRWTDENLQSHGLTPEQKHILYEELFSYKTRTFKALRKLKDENKNLLFPNCLNFNLEVGKRKDLKGHSLAFDMSKEDFFDIGWHDISSDKQNDIVMMMYETEDTEALIDWLTEEFDLTETQAQNISSYKLPRNSTMKLSSKCMTQLVEIMKETGCTYDKAVLELKDDNGNPLNLHHSYNETGEILDSLPYYGAVLRGAMQGAKPRDQDKTEAMFWENLKNDKLSKKQEMDRIEKHFGKIGNPTVHIAMNQLRKVVNALMEEYGYPAQVHIELSRDLKNPRKVRDDITAQNRKNESDRRRILKNILAPLGITEPSAQDYKKVQLWEELGTDSKTRQCPYSGVNISANMLFNGEAQVEHILPFSRTRDNGRSNQTISLTEANQAKGNMSPYEKWGRELAGDYAWERILQRAKKLPDNKSWRFSAEAMERYNDEQSFLDRQMTDNAYISKLARQYMSKICDPKAVVCSPGRLTGLLRGKWGLNSLLSHDDIKNRDDHRHHAIDAVVIALTTRNTLKDISTKWGADKRHHIRVPELSETIRKQLETKIAALLVSHKPDHGHQGKLFKETAYGLIDKDKREQSHLEHNTVVRKSLITLSRKNLEDIRDKTWRKLIIAYVDDPKNEGRKIEHILADFKDVEKSKAMGLKQPIKNIRVLEKWQTVQSIASAPFKGYVPDSYVCVDIWQIPKKKAGKWQKGQHLYKGTFSSYSDISSPPKDKNKLKPHPAAKHIMRLYKNDIVSFEVEDKETQLKTVQYFKVYGFSTTRNSIDLRPVNASNPKEKFVSINVILSSKLKKTRISIINEVQ